MSTVIKRSIYESILNDLSEKEKHTIISIQTDFRLYQKNSSLLKCLAKLPGLFLTFTGVGLLIFNRLVFRDLIQSFLDNFFGKNKSGQASCMEETNKIVKQINMFCYIVGASGLFLGLIYKSYSTKQRKIMRRVVISTLKTYVIRANLNTDSLNQKLNLNNEKYFKAIFDEANKNITYLQDNEDKVKSIDFLFNSLFITYSIRSKINENLFKYI
jgi:hypothetical protein